MKEVIKLGQLLGTKEQRDAVHVAISRGIDLYGQDGLDGDDKIFWGCIEAITGKTFDESHREEFGWSCADAIMAFATNPALDHSNKWGCAMK